MQSEMVLLVSAHHPGHSAKGSRAEELGKPRGLQCLGSQGFRGRWASPDCGQGDGWHQQAAATSPQHDASLGFEPGRTDGSAATAKTHLF